jgi:hypothetical protein
MTSEQIQFAIEAFERDLDSSICMEDRKASVSYLADRLKGNRTAANQIAEMYGLKDSYYSA